MKSLVIDANVVIKWVFPERTDEDHMPQALHLLQAIKKGMFKVQQPPHWLAETAAVVVRLNAKIAEEAVMLLQAMEFPVIDTPEVYRLACQLSQRFNHHLFDTLYHAVALWNGKAAFVTADEQYYQKASQYGSITRLADFSMFES